MTIASHDRLKDVVFGMLGSVPGMFAMRAYYRVVSSFAAGRPQTVWNRTHAQTVVSPSHQHTNERQHESSNAAAGRIIYQWITGSAPKSQQTRVLLGELAHWSYAAALSGAYGMIRGVVSGGDVRGGFLFGAALWLIDELGTPLVGLGPWPVTRPLRWHINHWAVHLAYGVASAATTQVLHRIRNASNAW